MLHRGHKALVLLLTLAYYMYILSFFWDSFLADLWYVELNAKRRFPIPGLTPDFHDAIFHVILVSSTNEDVMNIWLSKIWKSSGKVYNGVY